MGEESYQFGAITATRSPGWTPASRSAYARFWTRCALHRHVVSAQESTGQSSHSDLKCMVRCSELYVQDSIGIERGVRDVWMCEREVVWVDRRAAEQELERILRTSSVMSYRE